LRKSRGKSRIEYNIHDMKRNETVTQRHEHEHEHNIIVKDERKKNQNQKRNKKIGVISPVSLSGKVIVEGRGSSPPPHLLIVRKLHE